MPTRRSTLLGLGGLIAGGGAVLGTGAFTSVEAERTVNVETAGDQNAFLQLEPAVNGNGNQYPNAAEFADGTGDTLEITIGDQGSGGTGVNLNAITHIDRVFQVTNNGTQPIVLFIEEIPGSGTDGNAIDIGARLDQGILDDSENGLDSVGGSDQPSSDGIDDENIIDISYPSGPGDRSSGSRGYNDLGVYLDTGETLVAGVYIDTTDANLNDGLSESGNEDFDPGDLLLEDLVIYADATAAENGNYYVEVD
jgi:hypothetical protein